MTITETPHAWLDSLARNRAADDRELTPEIFDLTGPPPVPGLSAGRPANSREYVIAIELIAILTDERSARAVLKSIAARKIGHQQGQVDGMAEAAFWNSVRNWARTLKGTLP